MAGYFGSDQKIALQRRVDDEWDTIAVTPGLCNAVRFMSCDDPDALGWDRLGAILERDGLVGFRMLPAPVAARVAEWLAARGYRFDSHQVYLGDIGPLREATGRILASPLPPGLSLDELAGDPEGEAVVAVQTFMDREGVSPFSGSALTGERGGGITLVLSDAVGAIVATAHAYGPHNASSPHHRVAWVGLLAVAPERRGQGLGRIVNAAAVRAACDRLGAERVYQLVAAGNAPSRKVVEACGLTLDDGYLSGIGVPEAQGKFTR
ncbi:GNAT family N-acetyltransferase [Acuticoccus yangtzensis]|uniref:GNAT family N-acetyltransferase n=1 Tax=Acuticoccus yangtzensis TaxID=1443441 RepID=UPI000949724D|nr:GNAT family N-acetyltransferase [Acuticoccus yangtzensis]